MARAALGAHRRPQRPRVHRRGRGDGLARHLDRDVSL